MSDDDLALFVAGLEFTDATRLGLIDFNGELIAIAEGFPYHARTRTIMEVAFSTDASWRRCGLAKWLFQALARLACAQQIDQLVLQCDRRNAAMRGVLKAVGAQVYEDSGEISAVWQCAEALGEHA